MERYTRIENDILEALISSNLSSAELKIALFILRKTNGFSKTSDQVSFSQFIEHTGLSRQTVSNCLSQLKLVNIIRLVKNGVSKKQSNEWVFNKNVPSWQLVKRTRLVKFPVSTSQISGKQLVKLSRHTKETITKERIQKKENMSSRFKVFISEFNKITGRNFKGNEKVKGMLLARLRDGYEPKEIMMAVDMASQEGFLTGDNPSGSYFLTPEYILRPDKLDKWIETGKTLTKLSSKKNAN